ncbi:unnamed protein product [Calypogeia fissa]
MESQVLLVRRSHSAAAVAPHHQHGYRLAGGMKRLGGACPIPSSLGKQQWQFRVEKRVTLRPPKRTSAVEVRAKKSALDFKLPGSLKLKKGEPEDDEETTAGSGTKKFGTAKLPGTVKLPGTMKLPGTQRSRRKDNNVVFVAGATGKVGRRVVRELVQLGFTVRAGVRDVEKAQFLVEFAAGEPAEEEEEETEEKPEAKPNLWASFAPGKLFGFLGSFKKAAGVDLVEVDLERSEEIEDAIGNAGIVVCAIGASEKEALNVTAPYRIDYKATENLINAATDAKVNHFVLVTSLGTQKVGWPAAVLNLFWGVLVWKAKAEKALLSSGIPFTIVRPGGMEKPTDAFKETHNLVLDIADSRFGGQVSSLQVAELIGGVVSNLKLSQNKIVEVVAETTAPLRPIEDLLAELPSIDDVEAEKEAATQKISAKKAADEEEKLAKIEEAKAAKQREEEEKLAKKRELEAAKQREEEERIAAEEKRAAEQAKAEALRQKLQKEYVVAKEREEEAKRTAEEARLEKEVLEKRVAELRSKAEAAAQAAKEAKAVEAAVLAAIREGTTLSDKEKRDVVAALRAEEKSKKEAEAKAKAAEERAKKEAETKAIREAEAAKVEAEKKRQAAEAKIVAEGERAAKAEADLKAKAEADKKAKAEAEKREAEEKAKAAAKAKEEAEKKAKAAAKAKEEAEEKAKIEAAEKKAEDEKLKAEAEAKAKEEKLKAEAKAKAKAEEEAKLKAEAEAKAKAKEEEEAKLKAEAEAKAKAKEEEEKLKAKAEAKAKEERLKAQAEAKAKDATEAKAAAEQEKVKEVQVVASGDVFSEKKATQPFRWPWQKEQEPVVSEPVVQAAVTEEGVEEKVDELPRTSKPLSPYAQYPGLKPPTSPSPSPPEVEVKANEAVENLAEVVVNTAKVVEENVPVVPSPEVVEAAKAAAEELQRLAAQAAAEVKAREESALEKARATTATFLWPWQKQSAPENQTVTDQSPVVSSSSTSVQDELPRSNRPLSPYTRYPGLKPPTSPTPSPPISVSKSVTEELASNNGRELDVVEHGRFVDFKPPSSPTPSPAPSVEDNGSVLTAEVEAREQNTAPKAQETTEGKFFWPWQKREPEPLPEVEEEAPLPEPEPEAEPASILTAATAAIEKMPLSSTDLPRTSRPLSPYWRYPDLKPPTSPTPSPPRGKLEEKPVEEQVAQEL